MRYVGRLNRVLVPIVAVAEVIDQIDVRGHAIAQRDHLCRERIMHLGRGHAIAGRQAAFEIKKHCRRDIELDGELVVRYRRCNAGDLALEALVEQRLHHGLVVIGDESATGRMAGGNIDLKAAMGRNSACVFEPGKDHPRLNGAIGIEQVIQFYIFSADAISEPVSPHRSGVAMRAELFIGLLEGRVLRKNLFEEPNPVDPGTGLTIGNAIQIGSERLAERCEGSLGVGQRHAADDENVVCCHLNFPLCGSWAPPLWNGRLPERIRSRQYRWITDPATVLEIYPATVL